jgi:lipid A 3-O-deacylase
MGVSLAALALLSTGAARLWGDCPFPCLEPGEAPAAWSLTVAAVGSRLEADGLEIALTHAAGRRFGAFQPVAGVSLSSGGDAWAGGGVRWTVAGQRLALEASFMPGLYVAARHDLGHPVEFRSGLGVTWTFESGATLALVLDHRSNGGLGRDNPGLETVGLRWSWPLD